jgi:glycosyltransferase involved in cell wall biosynthesis/SAM-dependent methyltransferase
VSVASLCDALVVVFTRGVSLRDWEASGVLGREWALDSREGVGARVGRIVLVTYGGAEDRPMGERLGATVVCNHGGIDIAAFVAGVPASVRELLAESRRVVVKTNQMMGGEVALAVAAELRACGKSVGIVARGGYPWSRFEAWERGADSPEARAAAEQEATLIRGADIVVGTTPQMVDELAWRHGVARSRFRVVPNYTAAAASGAAPESRARSEILFAGRLERQKRVDRLIEAVAFLPPELGVRLTIVGEGSRGAEFKALAARLGVDAHFQGRVTHEALAERMRQCGVYCQTSDYEGHPKTVLEALAAGAPVVVCDTPGLREVVKDARTGLVAAADARAISESLEMVLRDPALGRALGAAAAEWARRELSLGRITGLELGAYQAALELGEAAEPAKADLSSAVRFEPALLGAGRETTVQAWTRAIRGFARRLPPTGRAEFVAALDTPLYHLQGEVAVEAAGGLHPKHRLMRYHDFFVERIASGEWVIDLGSGVGALAASMAERSRAHVTGMDWSRTNIERSEKVAAERGLSAGERRDAAGGSLSFVFGDITRDRAPGTFDAVALSNVLEHITERPRRLRMWREWYEPSRFLIRVPAFDREWRAPWKKELGVEWRLDPTHETEYTQPQLERELREAGLRITEMIARWGEYWCVASPA